MLLGQLRTRTDRESNIRRGFRKSFDKMLHIKYTDTYVDFWGWGRVVSDVRSDQVGGGAT